MNVRFVKQGYWNTWNQMIQMIFTQMEEGMENAFGAGQVKNESNKTLFSEDLY